MNLEGSQRQLKRPKQNCFQSEIRCVLILFTTNMDGCIRNNYKKIFTKKFLLLHIFLRVVQIKKPTVHRKTRFKKMKSNYGDPLRAETLNFTKLQIFLVKFIRCSYQFFFINLVSDINDWLSNVSLR